MDIILSFGLIMVISALACKMTNKAGIPVLVGFILIGVIIGYFFEFKDMETVDRLCEIALLLIIFTGGFRTDFKEAKSVLALSSVLSVGGVILTTVFAGAFSYFILGLDFYQSALLGIIISSTDAASVFSVLGSKNMQLKNNLASVLEIESGSNEPIAHMLTIMLITLATGNPQNIFVFLLLEVTVGAVAGIAVAKLGQFMINKLNVDIDGIYLVLLCGTAFTTFGTASAFGGNGFLAVYIGGMIIGNNKLVYKGFLSRMYSAVSVFMQISLFIILGILCIPASIMKVAGVGLIFALFLFFIARPLAVFIIMKPFGRPLKEIAFVSWAGFRGASSIFFATHLLTVGLPYAEYVFSIVFFVCMLSVIMQGSFVVPIAKKLKLIDE